MPSVADSGERGKPYVVPFADDRERVGLRSAAHVRPFLLRDSSLPPRLPDRLLTHHPPSTRPRLHRL
jgi:hypothetical protein